MNSNPVRKIDNYFLRVALGTYLVFWIALAIRPLDRRDWFLENLLIFVTAIVLIATYHRFQFFTLSYALILIFLTIHTIGAHYTYAKVPAGFWLQDWLHLKRNHYDRVIHFSFGFLLLYPMRELLRRSAQAHEGWATWLAVGAVSIALWLSIRFRQKKGAGALRVFTQERNYWPVINFRHAGGSSLSK